MIRDRQIVLTWNKDSDPSFLRNREWLLTNGLGGYASGTLAGIPARKYHGLFVPNLASPKGRHILISRCDECLTINGRQLHLGGAEYEAERFEGESHLFLREFRLDHRIAVWTFECEGLVFEKSITMVHNQNTVCVQYRLLQGEALDLQVRPFVSFRRHDESPHKEPGNFVLEVRRGRHEVCHTESDMKLRFLLRPGPTAFVTEELEESNFVYRIERDRGDPEFESAFSPGYLIARLRPDQPAVFVASSHLWERLDFDATAVFDAEQRRLRNLLRLAPAVRDDPVAEQLAMAADQFIVLPGSRLDESVLAQASGGELRSIYAGYHWFGDWGRDTMISLEGLTLSTGRYREAGAILSTFSHYVKDGLLPNLFPEGERQALYHTVDATLWYFHAISRYVDTTADRELLRNLFPVLQSIVQHHIDGTRFGIHTDPKDGLIAAAAEGLQLTWMDAKVDGWVVTPRRGKPVEIQALWHNALKLMAQWAAELRQPHDQYQQLATQVRDSFNERYWNEQRGCLYDVIDGPEGNDDAIRPNQIFALSLQHPVLYQRHWKQVVDTVHDKLLTPYGLRTLSSDHPDYKTHYRGNLRARDAAYHQGTVWPWLIGHYIDAYLRVYPDPAAARALLDAFPAHLCDAGIGSISEIFDAEEPFAPGGCVAQAWSVAEVLRAWLKTGPGASSNG
ncbi:MAG TPA: amylo-alpha-1,6-glucosidase [Steroidobacter sp.]|uniref:amylo-alpha-1,6-glucosidase n=1 Tax=Steroidobacter sp. TaxID=1978227 RepID=UPI002EDA6B0F